MVPFVYLTSPLFLNTAPLIEMEVRKQLLCGLRQKILVLYGSLVQGIILHLEINSSGTPFIDEQTLNYVKGEMESNSVSGTATFVAVNLDPRKLPSKVLRRLLTRKYSIRYWTK